MARLSPVARSRTATVLLFLVAAAVILASLALWLRGTVLDSERWTEAVAPLPAEEAVAEALAEYTVEEVIGEANLLQLSDLLPAEFDALPGSPAVRLNGLAEAIAAEAIASRAFARVWAEANMAAHGTALDALEGRGVAGQGVVLDLSPIIGQLRRDIAAAGVDLGEPGPNEGRISVLSVDQQSAAARTVRQLRRAAFILPVVALLLVLMALAVHPRRARAVAGVGIALIAAGLLTLGGLRVGRTETLAAVTAIDDPAVAAIWDVLARGLIDQSLVLVAVGAVIGAVGWYMGSSPAAARLRGKLGGSVATRSTDESSAVRLAGPAAALIGLLLWQEPGLAVAGGLAAVAAAWWILWGLVLRR